MAASMGALQYYGSSDDRVQPQRADLCEGDSARLRATRHVYQCNSNRAVRDTRLIKETRKTSTADPDGLPPSERTKDHAPCTACDSPSRAGRRTFLREPLPHSIFPCGTRVRVAVRLARIGGTLPPPIGPLRLHAIVNVLPIL